MSDDLLVEGGKHAITGLSSAGLVATFMRWLEGRKAEEMGTRLALIEQKLDQLVASAMKADSMREDVALLKASAKALHERVDRLESSRKSR